MRRHDLAELCYGPDPTPTHSEPRWDAATDPPVPQWPEARDPDQGCWLCSDERYVRARGAAWTCPTCGTESCSRCGCGRDHGCRTCVTGEEEAT